MILKKGSKGKEVYEVTQLLVKAGVLDEAKTIYDTEVARAVRVFQYQGVDSRGRPLTADGIVGPLTLWALKNEDWEGFFTPVPDSFYDIIEELDLTKLSHLALWYALEEMRQERGEVGGNNQGPHVAKYLRMKEEDLDARFAWCAGFVSWCVSQAAKTLNVDMPFVYTGGARNILKQARKPSTKAFELNTKMYDPQPGDLVVWYREAKSSWKGHVGIVHSYSNGILYVVEGNRGGYPAKVRVFDYTFNNMHKLLGLVRLP